MYTTPILISYGSDRHLPCSCSQTIESDSRLNRTYLCSASDTKMSMPSESRLAHRYFIIRGKWKHWYPGIEIEYAIQILATPSLKFGGGLAKVGLTYSIKYATGHAVLLFHFDGSLLSFARQELSNSPELTISIQSSVRYSSVMTFWIDTEMCGLRANWRHDMESVGFLPNEIGYFMIWHCISVPWLLVLDNPLSNNIATLLRQRTWSLCSVLGKPLRLDNT